jgi:PTH1 family peptidyl-tRNA hydrolase
LAVEAFRKAISASEWKEHKNAQSFVAKGEVDGESVELVLPQTYMNKSGSAVAKFVKSVKSAERLVVVYDELDLPIGKIKIAFSRGSGGHKGIESIARALKTKDFVRIRIGVSPVRPGKGTAKGVAKKVQGSDEVVDFILGTFKPGEKEQLETVFETVNEALESIITEGRERAMNQFN